MYWLFNFNVVKYTYLTSASMQTLVWVQPNNRGIWQDLLVIFISQSNRTRLYLEGWSNMLHNDNRQWIDRCWHYWWFYWNLRANVWQKYKSRVQIMTTCMLVVNTNYLKLPNNFVKLNRIMLTPFQLFQRTNFMRHIYQNILKE